MMQGSDLSSVVGRIFDIQRFSVHDGLGVRTIVFLKGCPLRCLWCCNPESQSRECQRMRTQDGVKDIGRDVTVGEVMEELVRDRPYFRRSGGGLTLSGGEALAQPGFALALLRSARDAGITTAIETTGFASREVLERLLPHIDYVLMDIKHMDSAKHKSFTSVGNERILESARYIASRGAALTVRTPVIPGFNATEGEIADIARFAASLPGVRELHLLPYHRMGEDKYAGLGRSYALSGVKPPTDEEMKHFADIAESFGLECRIGG